MRYTLKGQNGLLDVGGTVASLGLEVYKQKLAKTNVCALQKLGKHEDIDDDIGIEWPIVHKALKNGIYDIENDKFIRCVEFLYSGECDEWYIVNGFNEFETFAPKDYGITWALTKEELE